MAQRKHLTWTDLRVGIFVLVGLFILAVGIFYVTGATSFTRRYELRTYMSTVDGIAAGAPVRLNGITIGNVKDVRLVREATDPERNIELVLSVGAEYQEMIRTDSQARLTTEGLLGNRYVSIDRGFTGTAIQQGGEIAGVDVAPIDTVFDKTTEVADRVNAILSDLQAGKGTIGRLLTDDSLFLNLRDVTGQAEQLLTEVRAGKGTLGQLVTSEDLYRKVDSTVGRMDDILLAVQEQRGTLGKAIYDPSFHDSAKQLLDRSSSLIAGVQEGKGTLGMLFTDEALYRNLDGAAANLSEVTGKLNRGEGTAGKFFSDPNFYDNVTGLAGDLRLLIGEFRQDPKKFLRVKFSIF